MDTKVEQLRAKAVASAGFKLSEPPSDEQYEIESRASRVVRFKEKYSAKVKRGDGSVVPVVGNEYKLFMIAELFGYSDQILDILETNVDEILNQTNAVNLILMIEQIKLLRDVRQLLEKVVMLNAKDVKGA